MIGSACFHSLGRPKGLVDLRPTRWAPRAHGHKLRGSPTGVNRDKCASASFSRRTPTCCAGSTGSGPVRTDSQVVDGNVVGSVESTDDASATNGRANSANGASPSKDEAKPEVDTAEAWAAIVPEKVRLWLRTNPAFLLVKQSATLLFHNLWSILSLTIINSAARFALCWALYKTVSAVAIVFFGVPASSIPEEMLPAMGTEGDSPVYSQLADITFLVFKPLDFLLKGFFLGAMLIACKDSDLTDQKVSTSSLENGNEDSGNLESKKSTKWQFVKRIWEGVCLAIVSLWKSTKSSPRIVIVHVFVGVLTAICQGLCLLIIPFLFAIRRLMDIQLALFTSVVEGLWGKAALKRSKELVEPIRPMLYLPYIVLFVSPKFLGAMRDSFLRVLPERLFTDVPELSWGLVVAVSITSFLIDRMHDVLPVVVYATAIRTSMEGESE